MVPSAPNGGRRKPKLASDSLVRDATNPRLAYLSLPVREYRVGVGLNLPHFYVRLMRFRWDGGERCLARQDSGSVITVFVPPVPPPSNQFFGICKNPNTRVNAA
jgi:hypothetical protein